MNKLLILLFMVIPSMAQVVSPMRYSLKSTIQDTFFSGFSDKYKLGNFDLVTSCHTIEHFNASDITNIFDEVKKMLKPGGIFFCGVPHANLHKFPDVNEVVNLHLSFFSINSIQNFVQKIGMEVIFCSTCGEKFSTKIAIPDVPKDDRERLYNEKFYLDSEEKVLINREHEVFHKKLKKKQDIKGLVVYLSSKIIGKKNTFKLLDLNIELNAQNEINTQTRLSNYKAQLFGIFLGGGIKIILLLDIVIQLLIMR